MTSYPTHVIPLPTVTELPRALEPVTPDTFLEAEVVDVGVRAPRPEPPDVADSPVDR